MRSLAILLPLLLLGCANQKPDPRPIVTPSGTYPVAESSDRELDVLEAILRHEHPTATSTGATLVISELTSADILLDTLPEEGSDEVSIETVREFKRLNKDRFRLPESLSQRLPIHYLTEPEAKSIWENRRRDGWKYFYTLYPKSSGHITVSRVGFSPDGGTAIVYHGCQSHWLAGAGQIFVLKQRDGRWHIEPIHIGDMWVS
jgi:hypothetical protein